MLQTLLSSRKQDFERQKETHALDLEELLSEGMEGKRRTAELESEIKDLQTDNAKLHEHVDEATGKLREVLKGKKGPAAPWESNDAIAELMQVYRGLLRGKVVSVRTPIPTLDCILLGLKMVGVATAHVNFT